MKFEKIIFISKDEIQLKVKFFSSNLWEFMESIFHAAGMHLRYILDFQKHVFLVKVSQLVFNKEVSESAGYVCVKLVSSSKNGALYRGQLYNGEVLLSAKFILGIKDFDEMFKKSLIKPYYEEIFRCLISTK